MQIVFLIALFVKRHQLQYNQFQLAGSFIEKPPFKKLAQTKIPQSQIVKFPLHEKPTIS